MEGVTALDTVAERLQHGEALRDEDAAVVLGSHDLVSVGMLADDVRRQMHGAETTFVRVFEVHVDAVPSQLPDGTAAGEFRIVGTPASLDAARAAVEAARRLAPGAPLFGFALHEIQALGPLDSTIPVLVNAGLDGVAEVAIDVDPSPRAVEQARTGGLLVLRATVHAPPSELLPMMTGAREFLRQSTGFRTFAPLPRQLSTSSPTTGYDDVKAVAVARLMIREVPSVQVDWPLYGPKLAQVGLIVGANDVDGVLAVDGGVLGARRSPLEEIRGNIRAAGLVAVERDGRFERRDPAQGRTDG
jgi:aminodeoxyfutalosine synthase